MHQVIVVGAGPAGLALTLELRRLGVEAIALDRGTEPTRYPKARVVGARTMELLRRWGLASEVRAAALPGDWCRRIVVAHSLAGPELARVESRPDAEPRSPEQPVLCTQDVLEHILAAEVERCYPDAIRWRSEVVGLAPDDEGVTLAVRTPDGATARLRARYVACADGIRDLAGTVAPGAGRRQTVARQVSVLARIDLRPWTSHRPAGIYYLADRGLAAQLLVVDGEREWVISALGRRGESAADYPPQRVRELLAAVCGVPAGDPVIAGAAIREVRVWDLAFRVAEAFCNGRILRAGDAAHEILPTGGMGMNLALADAEALAWRLAAILRGWGSPGLLADYDDERRAVALATAAWTRSNLNTVAALMGAATRGDIAAVRETAPALAGYLDHPGLDLGPLLGADPGDPRELVDDGRPGSRAPHLPLDGGHSTVDLYGTRPALLVDRDESPAAKRGRRASRLTGVPLTVVALGDLPWSQRHGVTPAGAVLVRPDGYVSWRALTAAAASTAGIAGALRRLAGFYDDASLASADRTASSTPVPAARA